jgi:uncharacterized protein (DUF934 family)
MPLLDGEGLRAERWTRVADGAPVPPGADVILPLARFAAELEGLARTGGRLGVQVANTVALAALTSYLPRLALIAIEFPSFADGRGFSLARQLRLAGFTGELRATGHVIADQLGFLRACGFDTVELDAALAARQPAEHWVAAARAFSLSYQRGYDGPRNVLEARRAARARRLAAAD